MTCRNIEAFGFRYRFCPDDLVRDADRLRAVVRWTVEDEITRQPPNIEFALTSDHPALRPRVSRDGVMGLIGYPGRLFPGLAGASVDLLFTIAAHGYLPRRLTAPLGPIAGFPGSFNPADLGVVALHRMPIILRGRVVRRVGSNVTPIAGSTISITGVWRTFPPPDVDPNTVVEPPNLLSLHPGLYADRVSPTHTLRRRNLPVIVGQDKRLLRPAVQGDRVIQLTNCVNLNVNDILAVDPDISDRIEYIRVSAIDPASTTDQPAVITLTHPLALDHTEGVRCARATPQAPGSDLTLSRPAIPREQVAFLASAPGLTASAVVEIGSGSTSEYQTASPYQTLTDADGYYRLPPISRVASIRLRAQRLGPPPTSQQVVISPDYRRFENRVEFIFP